MDSMLTRSSRLLGAFTCACGRFFSHGMCWDVQSFTCLSVDLLISQLNDVLSLCVGLWAVRVANDKTRSTVYTYGVSPAVLTILHDL